MTRSRFAPTLLVFALMLAGCGSVATRDAAEATAPPAPSADAAPVATPAGPAASDNLNAVAWVQASAEYRLLAEQTYRSATALLDRALATRDWDALVPDERANPAAGLPPAVIVDIDETVLDNSPYQARLVRDGGSYDEVTWDAWVREERAAPVPGALEFARAAAAKGVTVFYVSNRAEHLEDATLANLRALGFPLDRPDQFLGLGYHVDGCEQHGSEKTCRRQWVG